MLWNTQLDEATHRKIHIANNILKEDVMCLRVLNNFGILFRLFLCVSTLSSFIAAY